VKDKLLVNQAQNNSPDIDIPDTPKTWKRFVPLFVLVAGLGLILSVMQIYDIDIWDSMAAQYGTLSQWIMQHVLVMIIGFITIYTLAVAFSVPGAVFLTLMGGALFGWIAVIMVVFSASLGALMVFLAARGALATFFQASGSRFINRLKHGFDRSPFYWLLALRMMPIAPFWVVNIIPAMLGMRVMPYMLATVIGIIPGSAVYVYVGIGFGDFIAAGETPNLAVLSEPRYIGPLLALSALALIPPILKTIRSKQAGHKDQS